MSFIDRQPIIFPATSYDAFGRFRVSDPSTVFESKQLVDSSPLFWDEVISGSASSTYSQVEARTRLAVTANGTDYAIRQTKMSFNYQAGKSQEILITTYIPPQANVTKRVGLFNGTPA